MFYSVPERNHLLAQIHGSNVALLPFCLSMFFLENSFLEFTVKTFWKFFSIYSRHSFENFECIFQSAFGQEPPKINNKSLVSLMQL
jgi:hypothetical protein